jgi:ABC-type uncharacterized transport system substrate-binding protein
MYSFSLMLSSLKRILPGLLLIIAASAALVFTDRSGRTNQAVEARSSARRIAIIQFASIAAFEIGRHGMERYLAEVGYSSALGSTIDNFNAEADLGTLAQICAQVSKSAEPYDLVITLGTATTRSFVNANEDRLPHVFGILSSPPSINIPLGPYVAGALAGEGRPSKCCGVGSMQPVEALFRDLVLCAPRNLPDGKMRVGCVWNPAEPNAEANVALGKAICATLNIELVGANGSSVTEVVAACDSVLARGVDAFWLPADVTVNSAASAIVDRCRKARVPAISNSPEMFAIGCAINEGSEWDALGVTTGVYAELVLRGVAPSAIPIENFVPIDLTVDLSGFTEAWNPPAEFLARASTIVDVGKPTIKRPTSFARAPDSAMALLATALALERAPKRIPFVSMLTYSRTPNVEEAYAGFLTELGALGYVDGTNIELSMRDAQFDIATLGIIVAAIAEEAPDVVVPFTTPALQAAARKITERPIVFSLVASGVAAGVGTSESEHLPNVTGAQASADWDRMIAIVKAAMPNLTRAGTVFAPGEANSVHFRDEWKVKLAAAGIELISAGSDRPTELSEAADSLIAQNVQAILQISDNASGTGFATIVKSADRANIPVFCFTSAGLKTGATIGVARDFDDVGRLSARLVDRVLRGEKVANIPFANPTRTLVLVNPDRMQRFGLVLPRSILDSAKEVRE